MTVPAAAIDETFEAFFRRRGRDLHRYATAILGLPDADDACQEAWLRIWSAWRTADPERREAWAHRIVRNCCIDRQRARRPHQRLDELARQPASPPADEGLEARDAAGTALRYLSQLSTPLRETLWLREVSGLSYAEIAAVQDVPVGTVMSRLHSGRRKVSRMLREDGR